MLPSLPPSVYVAFIVSFVATVLLVLTKHWHGRFSLDGVEGVQKQHKTPTPRIGGVAIVVGMLAAWFVARPERRQILGPLLIAGLPAFAFGLAEDLTKKVSVMARLLATMASGIMGWWLTGIAITSLDIIAIDALLSYTMVSVLFTAFAVGGVANAINIIDGFNGLASGFVTLALSGVALMAYSSSDTNLALACLSLAAAVFGFWLINWPFGKIFLGDGGSYFGGFALAWACVLLVERNHSVTPFAALMVCIHPVSEVVFSIFRRWLRNAHPGKPDRLHLHSLIMRRVVRPALKRQGISQPKQHQLENAWTGLTLALMTLPAVALAWLLRHQPVPAAMACMCFALGYVSLYARMVRFKWCSPISFLFDKPQQMMRARARRYAFFWSKRSMIEQFPAGWCSQAPRNTEEDTHFRIMRILQDKPDLTQRELAQMLGMSVGALNYCLKALINKGFVKMDNFQKSKNKFKYVYLLTPQGIAEKVALTTRFLKRKMDEYEVLEQEIEQLKAEVIAQARPQVQAPASEVEP